MIKIRTEISGLENRQIKQKIIKATSHFLNTATKLINPKLDWERENANHQNENKKGAYHHRSYRHLRIKRILWKT